jgi:ESCRT-II complex subunit VPS36
MAHAQSTSGFLILPPAALTQSGLLKLDSTDGEVELLRRSGMEFRSNEHEREINLVGTLTTHRLVFQTPSNNARFLHLSQVQHIEKLGGPSVKSLHWNSSHKILVNTFALGEIVIVFKSTKSSPLKDRDDMYTLMNKTLERRAWEAQARIEQKKRASEQIAKRKVGVDAIMSKNALRHKEASRLADLALDGDTEQLLREATELVNVIQKYVATLQRQPESSSDDQDEDIRQLASLLSDMGMASALTKNDVRGDQDQYMQILARQIADFILPKLKQIGGVMTLTDVFCLFNRARGTNLISPDDLCKAMELTKTLNLGVFLREFPSGIKVVQLEAMENTSISKKLLALCAESDSLTVLQASRALHISPLLANEHLLEAEREGCLCRDVTLETTRFYPNRFEEFVK